MENSMEFLQKTKNKAPIFSSNLIPGHISGEDENCNLKRCIHHNVHRSTICNSKDMEKSVSIDRWMDKEDVGHIYMCVFIYISAIRKNEILPFAATWVDLENIILSEVNQRKTNIIYHLYVESKK